MKIRRQLIKRIIAVLSVMLFLAYAFVAFVPHAHDCVDSHCAICSMLEASRNVLLGLSLVIGAYQIINNRWGYTYAYADRSSNRDGTPVGLKVKLSD